MTKKIKILLAVIAACVVVAGVTIGIVIGVNGSKPAHEHTGGTATCTQRARCEECGEEYGELLAHVFDQEVAEAKFVKSDATCVKKAVYYKSCKCGAKGEDTFESGELSTEHNFGEWTSVEGGMHVRKCKDCEKEESGTCTGGEATCTEKAKCEVCGGEYGELAAHVFDQEVVDAKFKKSDATCGKKAIYYKSCKCGEKGKDTFQTGNALSHNYVWKSNNGTHAQVCLRCGGKGSSGTCTGGTATCSQKATCRICGGKYGETTEHTGVWTKLEGKDEHSRVCLVCGQTETKKCSGGTLTCTEQATCEVCGEKYGAPSHSWNDGVITKSATCIDGGVKTYTCAVCGGTKTEQIAALGHDFKGKQPTCTEGVKCERENCGYEESAKGHVYGETPISSTEADCVNAATETYQCTVCSETKTESVGAAKGHNTDGVEATYEKLKENETCVYLHGYKCKNCGETVYKDEFEKHELKATIAEAATCVKKGRKTYTCSVENCEYTYDEEIPVNGAHNWGDEVVSGNKKIYKCQNAGCIETKTVIDAEAAEAVSKDDIKAANEVGLTEATFEFDDNAKENLPESVKLSATKATEEEKDALNLSDKQKEQIGNAPIYNFGVKDGSNNSVDFNGENDGKVTVIIPYTLAEGDDVDSIAVWYISGTGEVKEFKAEYFESNEKGYVKFETTHFSFYTVTRLTPVERCRLYGHEYRENTVTATCEAEGYVLHTCVRCGDSYKDKVEAAKGHNYVENVIREATCTQQGKIEYVCKNKGCASKYTKTELPLGHNYEITVISPTCETRGYTEHKCSRCQSAFETDVLPARGHNYKTEWTWGDFDEETGYTKATLKITCLNDVTDSRVIEGVVTKEEKKGTCTIKGKVTYTATAEFNGTFYVDEKVIETENDVKGHILSDEYSFDGKTHYRVCLACKEKVEVESHVFEETIIKAATCVKQGKKQKTCKVCGYSETVTIVATGEHNFVNGVCSECGLKQTSDYFVNLVNSYKNVNGIVVKIENLSIESKGKNLNNGEFEVLGYVKQLDITQLYIYAENGKLKGAAIGNVEFFAGYTGLDGALNATLKAVVDGDYTYISLIDNKTGKSSNVKFLTNFVGERVFYLLGIFNSQTESIAAVGDALQFVADGVINKNSAKANGILEKAFNMAFTFEKQTDGTFVATLDYDKLNALNENLAKKTIAEVIDIYFGNGSFDSLCSAATEILNLKVGEIPEYMNGLGVDFKELAAKINAYVSKIGADKDYDLEKIISDERYKDIAVGTLIFGGENYLDNFNSSVVESLRKNSLYALIGGDAASLKAQVKNVLDILKKGVTLSFTTDGAGMLSGVNLDFDKFNLAFNQNNNQLDINFDLRLTINEKIDVAWENIVEDIENSIVYPTDDMLEKAGLGGLRAYITRSDSYEDPQKITIDGNDYYCSYVNVVRATKTVNDKILLASINPDCGDWFEYQICYAEEVYRFTYYTCEVDDGAIVMLVDENSGEYAKLLIGDVGEITVIYQDGTQKTIKIDASEQLDGASLYAKIYFEVFPDAVGKIGFDEMSVAHGSMSYFYNPELGEYADYTHHDFEYTYEFENGESCEGGWTAKGVCKNCGQTDVTVSTSHDHEQELVFNSNILDGVCKDHDLQVYVCGDGYSNYFEFDRSSFEYDEATDTYYCKKCNLKFKLAQNDKENNCLIEHSYSFVATLNGKEIRNVARTWFSVEHDYDVVGATADGITVSCKKCAIGNDTAIKTVDLEEHDGKYYYDYYVTPAKNGVYTIIGCNFEDTYVELYKQVNGEYILIDENDDGAGSGQFRLEKTLEAGTSYFYRVRFYDNSNKGKISFMFRVDESKTGACEHDYVDFAKLFDGAENCEGGVAIGRICKKCGEVGAVSVSYNHEDVLYKNVQLNGGYLNVYRCACGETIRVEKDGCNEGDYKYTHETIDGKEYGVETNYCDECDYKYVVKSYRETEGCYTHVYSIYYLIVKGEVILDNEAHESIVSDNHIYVYKFELNGETCEDGWTATATCYRCGDSFETHGSWHKPQRTEYHDLKNELGACDGCVEVYSCACGENQDYRAELNCSFDWVDSHYKCRNCGLEYVDNDYNEKIDCVRVYHNIRTYTRNGKTVGLNVVHGSIEHNYIAIDYSAVDGDCENGFTVTFECADCRDTYKKQGDGHSEFRIERIYLNDKEHFVEKTRCACGKKNSVNFGLCQESEKDNYTETIDGKDYSVNMYKCDECGYTFVIKDYSVTEGCYTYYRTIYRLTLNGEIVEGFDDYTVESVAENNHLYVYKFVLNGETCEDGWSGVGTCVRCGKETEIDGSYCYEYLVAYRDFKDELGSCGGHIEQFGCACGKRDGYINEYLDCELIDMPDGSGKRRCRKCGLIIEEVTTEDYQVENCTIVYTTYYTATLGDKKVALSCTRNEEKHDLVRSAALINGATSCEQGVIISDSCRYCDYSRTRSVNDHELVVESEEISLNSVCGGVAKVYTCACGKIQAVSLADLNCELDDSDYTSFYKDSENLPEKYADSVFGKLYNGFENSDSSLRYGYYLVSREWEYSSDITVIARVYTCAVTNPACAYKIVRVTYFKNSEYNEQCVAEEYQDWYFGYNADTSAYDRKVTVKTGRAYIVHNFVKTGITNGLRYECSVCGSYYESVDYNNGEYQISVITAENKLNNDRDAKYYRYEKTLHGYIIERICEYTSAQGDVRKVTEIYEYDEESWLELYYKQTILLNGKEEFVKERRHAYDTNGRQTYKKEWTNNNGDVYWLEETWDYSDIANCNVTHFYKNSDGEERSEVEKLHGREIWTEIVKMTCTQNELYVYVCEVCGEVTSNYSSYSPEGHRWVECEDGGFECSECGLKNANGANGKIILEDLTDKIDDGGENYAIGYYYSEQVEQTTQYVSIVKVVNGKEVENSEIVLADVNIEDYYYKDFNGSRIKIINKAALLEAVKAKLTELGESENINDYALRFTFAPLTEAGDLDYAITFDNFAL